MTCWLKKYVVNKVGIIVLTISSLLLCVGCSVQHRYSKKSVFKYKNPTRNEMPIMASHSLTPPFNTLKKYKELNACGFNMSFSYALNIEEVEASLKQALKSNVKLMVYTPEIFTERENAIKRLSSYKSLAGYYIFDEPNQAKFQSLRRTFKDIPRYDSKHLLYVNLLPNYASSSQLGINSYQSYLQQFCEEVEPSFMSFDNYPITNNGVRTGYFKNIREVKAQCDKFGIPFWGFILCAKFAEYPAPSISTISFQVFSNLLFGAKGLQYYTYCYIDGYSDTPLDKYGNKTETYDVVAQVNHQVQNMAHYILDAELLSIGYIEDFKYEGIEKLPQEEINQLGISACQGGIVVSVFINKGKKYYLVFNSNLNETRNVKLERGDRFNLTKEGKWKKMNVQSTVTIQPGSAVLIK